MQWCLARGCGLGALIVTCGLAGFLIACGFRLLVQDIAGRRLADVGRLYGSGRSPGSFCGVRLRTSCIGQGAYRVRYKLSI